MSCAVLPVGGFEGFCSTPLIPPHSSPDLSLHAPAWALLSAMACRMFLGCDLCKEQGGIALSFNAPHASLCPRCSLAIGTSPPRAAGSLAPPPVPLGVRGSAGLCRDAASCRRSQGSRATGGCVASASGAGGSASRYRALGGSHPPPRSIPELPQGRGALPCAQSPSHPQFALQRPRLPIPKQPWSCPHLPSCSLAGTAHQPGRRGQLQPPKR